jgi:dienelactone hydrolase
MRNYQVLPCLVESSNCATATGDSTCVPCYRSKFWITKQDRPLLGLEAGFFEQPLFQVQPKQLFPHKAVISMNLKQLLLAEAKSCTVSVTFKPTKTGPRSASLSISDSSADHTQHVSLSGSGWIRCRAQIKQSLSGSPVRSALTTNGAVAVPRPTGPSAIGTRVMRLVDSTRDDPFLENGTKRELMVRFWYPARPSQTCKQAEYAPATIWAYFSHLMGNPRPAVTTNSCLNSAIDDGTHPMVVFSHGYTGTFTDYTYIFEDLASRGYVVVSVDHTYEATAVEFPDGRFVRSAFGSHLGRTLLEDEPSLSFALSVRLDDLKFVAKELVRLNSYIQSPFAGKFDTNNIAIAGHSMGGLAAALGVEREPHFKAGVIIDVHDGYVPEDVVAPTATPVLLMASGREQWSENECRLWSRLQGPRLAVNFKGAEHLTTSDAVWLARDAIKTGTMGPDKSVDAVRDYIAAFLDMQFRNQPASLLTGLSSNYPDAVVVTQNEALCSKSSNGPTAPSGESH